MTEKLVRDKAKDYFPDDNYRTVTGKEYYLMLLLKLEEEVTELVESNCTDPLEYADVLTVLSALANYKKIPHSTIKKSTEKKLLEHGGFKKGIVWIKDDKK